MSQTTIKPESQIEFCRHFLYLNNVVKKIWDKLNSISLFILPISTNNSVIYIFFCLLLYHKRSPSTLQQSRWLCFCNPDRCLWRIPCAGNVGALPWSLCSRRQLQHRNPSQDTFSSGQAAQTKTGASLKVNAPQKVWLSVAGLSVEIRNNNYI